MNRKRRKNLKHKTHKFHFVLILSFLFTLGFVNYGCQKECDDEVPTVDEYYVKYEVNSTTIYYGGKLDVTINKEDNTNSTFIINQRILWEAIIGPVQKGFAASMKVEATGETYDKLKIYTNIYVSKNGSPFALKKSDGSDTPRDIAQINYTIDY